MALNKKKVEQTSAADDLIRKRAEQRAASNASTAAIERIEAEQMPEPKPEPEQVAAPEPQTNKKGKGRPRITNEKVKRKQHSISLQDPLYERVMEQCARENRNFPSLVENALIEYLDHHGNA